MKFIDWLKKNYLIAILFIITVLVLAIKINIFIKDNQTNNLKTSNNEIKRENETKTLISPSPTVTKEILYEGKTKEEILQMEPEKQFEFVTNLSQEEIEELDMMPNYDFSEFLPEKKETFIAESFSYKDRVLTVTGLIDDKEKMLKEINGWLFYETGNNSKTIKIIWK
jgi:hypothetical protein